MAFEVFLRTLEEIFFEGFSRFGISGLEVWLSWRLGFKVWDFVGF